MPAKLQKIWKNLYETFKGPTEICKICFNEIKTKRIVNLMMIHNVLCDSCADLFNPIWKRFKLGAYTARAIYHYDETIRTYLYQFKGCYDYELKDVFLYRYLSYLKLKYHRFYIVYVPSYHIDDERRGFNHVKAIFESLKLKELPILKKKTAHKQSDQSSLGRRQIKDVIEIDENTKLKDKKVLLVDDIMTTGSTLLTSIELLKSKGAKNIEILVVAKTKMKRKEEY